MRAHFKALRQDSILNSQKLDALLSNEEIKRFKDWLEPPDPSTDAHSAAQKRHPGTGAWFLEDETYRNWRSFQNSFLWLHGESGCGKSVLIGSVLHDLRAYYQPPRALLYFFFTFSDAKKQTMWSLLCTMVVQLYIQSPASRKIAEQLYTDCQDGNQKPIEHDLSSTFKDMLRVTGHDTAVVIDALDECTTRSTTAQLLKEIRELDAHHIHILVTARTSLDVKTTFARWEQLPMQKSAIDKDISTFVSDLLRTDTDLNDLGG